MSNGFTRASFGGGASPDNLSSGEQVQFSDGLSTQTLTVDYVSGAYLFVTVAYGGNNVTLSNDELLYSSGEALQLKTYAGTSPSFQVSGTSIMSGTTDLLDVMSAHDGYVTGATFSSPTLTLSRNQGLSDLTTTLYNNSNNLFWSGTSAGNIVNSGLTGNVGIGTDSPDYELDVAGDIGLDQYLYHNGDANTHIQFKPSILNLVVANKSMIKLDMTASQDKIQLNNSNDDIDLNVMGDDSSVILSTDASNNRVGINTTTANEALTVDGNISGTTNLYISGDTHTTNLILAADGYIMPSTSSNTIKMRAQTYDGEMVSIGPDLFQVNMNSAASVMITPTYARFNATNKAQDFSVMTDWGNFSIENKASLDLLALGSSGGTSIGGTTARWPTSNGSASSGPNKTLQVNGITTIYSGGTDMSWSADTTALTVIGDIQAGNDLIFPDNGQAIFGDGNDLKIYHSGSHSIIQESGIGNLLLKGGAVKIMGTTTGDECAVFTENAGVELYYDDVKKFETTNTGTEVTGVLSAHNITLSQSIGTSGDTIVGGDLYTDQIRRESSNNTQVKINLDANQQKFYVGDSSQHSMSIKEGMVSGTSFNVLQTLGVSGTTTLTAGGTTFEPRPNLYFHANCDGVTTSGEDDGSLPATNVHTVQFAENINSHASVFSITSDEITIARAGIYKFTYNCTIENAATNNRASAIVGLLEKSGATGTYAVVDGTEGYTYNRMGLIDRNTVSTTVLYDVTAGRVFTVVFAKMDSSNAATTMATVPAGTSLVIEAVT